MSDTRTRRELPAFPESVLNPNKTGKWPRRLLIMAVVVALVAGSVALLGAGGDDPVGTYRTAAVTNQQIEQTQTGVAAIEPVSQAAVAFPTSGVVANVDVSVGDSVAMGQALADLDPEQLEETLRQREADLAQAELVLSVALDGDDPSSVTGGALGASNDIAADTELVVAEDTATVLLAVYTPEKTATILEAAVSSDEIAAAQQAVIEAQQNVALAMIESATALESATLICDAVVVETVEACQTALNGVVVAQQAVSNAQAELSAAAATLDALLTEWAVELDEQSSTTTTVPDSTTTTPPEEPSTTTPEPSTTPATPPDTGTLPSGDQPSGGRGTFSGGSAAPETESPSSEDLIAYQSAVDAAALHVAVAEQALAQATIVSPIAGTVTAVNFQTGDEVTGSSETQTIVIEGEGGYEATLMVSITDVAEIEVGQTATLVSDGSAETNTGQVVQVSAVPASNTSTYRVTIGLDGETTNLRNGNIGNVSIVTASADSVLAVPTSAVNLDGTSHTVTVVNEDGTVNTVSVEAGVVGTEWTEIIGGDLDAGQEVVLADLDEPLPGSATEVTETEEFVLPGGVQGGFPDFG